MSELMTQRALSQGQLRKLKRQLEKEKSTKLDDAVLASYEETSRPEADAPSNDSDDMKVVNSKKLNRGLSVKRKRQIMAELKSLKAKKRNMTKQDAGRKKELQNKIIGLMEELKQTEMTISPAPLGPNSDAAPVPMGD